jgi:hypothetical protein
LAALRPRRRRWRSLNRPRVLSAPLTPPTLPAPLRPAFPTVLAAFHRAGAAALPLGADWICAMVANKELRRGAAICIECGGVLLYWSCIEAVEPPGGPMRASARLKGLPRQDPVSGGSGKLVRWVSRVASFLHRSTPLGTCHCMTREMMLPRVRHGGRGRFARSIFEILRSASPVIHSGSGQMIS